MNLLYAPNWKSQQRQFEKKNVCIYPVRLAMEATYQRNQGHNVWFDKPTTQSDKYDRIITEPEGIPFLDLPIPDRKLTNAFHPKYQNNGNYKYHPGAYMLSASGCWHGKCTFCVEKNQQYQVRSVESVIEELEGLYAQGFKEVFDDSGTFPDGDWLEQFCIWKCAAGLADLPFSCNMRIGANVDFDLMKMAGFRMLLYGVESANQETLTKIKKGFNYDQIIPTIKQASEAGLSPHIAVMFGYPWEKDKDSRQTLRLAHYLLRKGYATTAQSSFYDVEGEKSNEEAKKYVSKIFEVWKYPEFWYNKIKDIKSKEDWGYFCKQIKEGLKNV